MGRRVGALACALCLLAGCGQPGQEDSARMTGTAEEAPVEEVEHAAVPAEPEAPAAEVPWKLPEDAVPLPERELRPYEAWVFQPEPYLVTVEAYGELFSLKEEVYDQNGWTVVYRRPKGLLKNYHWYGVPEMFPFIALADQGLREGTYDWRVDTAFTCDEAYAMACRYYTRAIEFDAPDGTQYVEQESNYPQFRWPERWYWAGFGAGYTGEEPDSQSPDWRSFDPEKPMAYREPIRIQTAMMNWLADGWLPDNDFQNLDVYADLTLSERVALQNDWLTERGMEERAWMQENHPEWDTEEEGHYNIPESGRWCAATGLTILNGDSRTEETYFAGSRAKTIRITVDGESVKETTLADSPAPQLITLDHIQPTLAKPLDITIEVLDSYPGQTDDIYITEIGVGLSSNLPQGH